MALMNVLAAIEWPEDEMAVFAALRGPFLAVSDEALLLWRESEGEGKRRRLHPLIRVEGELPPLLEPVAEALSLLATLHWKRNGRPFADTVNAFLEATRAHAGL
ncbi:MAG: hypothetical protein AAGH68_11165, partial [Pseudomonadota bacterium]